MWLADSSYHYIEAGSRAGDSLLSTQPLPPDYVAYDLGEGLESIEAREGWSWGSIYVPMGEPSLVLTKSSQEGCLGEGCLYLCK